MACLGAIYLNCISNIIEKNQQDIAETGISEIYSALAWRIQKNIIVKPFSLFYFKLVLTLELRV